MAETIEYLMKSDSLKILIHITRAVFRLTRNINGFTLNSIENIQKSPKHLKLVAEHIQSKYKSNITDLRSIHEMLTKVLRGNCSPQTTNAVAGIVNTIESAKTLQMVILEENDERNYAFIDELNDFTIEADDAINILSEATKTLKQQAEELLVFYCATNGTLYDIFTVLKTFIACTISRTSVATTI